MSTSSRGNAAERLVARWLEESGHTVGSRRHIGGAGDLLAVSSKGRVKLVEVKRCKDLWQNFRREDREAMKEAKAKLPEGSEIWLVNVKPNKEMNWVPESRWPESKSTPS